MVHYENEWDVKYKHTQAFMLFSVSVCWSNTLVQTETSQEQLDVLYAGCPEDEASFVGAGETNPKTTKYHERVVNFL